MHFNINFYFNQDISTYIFILIKTNLDNFNIDEEKVFVHAKT